MDGSGRLTDRNCQFLKSFQPPRLTVTPTQPTLSSPIDSHPVESHHGQVAEESHSKLHNTSPDGVPASMRNGTCAPDYSTGQGLDPVGPQSRAGNDSVNDGTANGSPKPALPLQRLRDFNSPGLKEADSANRTTRVRRPPDRFGHAHLSCDSTCDRTLG